MEAGIGAEAVVGAALEISYSVFRLASGGYFKNSAGGEARHSMCQPAEELVAATKHCIMGITSLAGTPVYIWGIGDGIDPFADTNETYDFRREAGRMLRLLSVREI